MQKSDFIRFPLTLLAICLMASALLGAVYSSTKDKIQAQKELEEELSLKEVLPQAATFDFQDRGVNSFYIAKADDGTIVGYAFVAEKKGYASVITTMVGMTHEGTITGIKILSQNETPGLGSKIIEVVEDKTIWSVLSQDSKTQEIKKPKPWFQMQFEGKDATTLVGVDTITGATISSMAVIGAIKEKVEVILQEIENVG